MSPTLPHPVAITLKQSDGSPRINTNLIVINRNTGNELFATTNSQGQAVVDLANFTEGYTIEDPIIIKKIKENVTTTKIFEGKLEKLKSITVSGAEGLELGGGHISKELIDITVTREYNGNITCDAIIKELIDNYLTGYTYTNVETSTETPNIKWSNKPFWEAVEDICRLAVPEADITATKRRFDCYVDDDKDFHFFEENSIENNEEAIVWNDTLLQLDGFGEEQNLIRNKVITYGDDGTGLPIINTSEDVVSQNDYGIKEFIVTDSNIITTDMAVDIGSSELNNQKDPQKQGSARCFIMPKLTPGSKIWISEPTSKIIQQNKIAKFMHTFPIERTKVVLTRKKNLVGLFRDRMLKDIAQDDIINPYEMSKSINFTFDDGDLISSQDSNVVITEGRIKLSSGTTGEFISNIFQNNIITDCHLKVVGQQNTNTVYKVSTDGGENYSVVIPETLTALTPGKDIILKTQLNSASAEIDSIALLIK